MPHKADATQGPFSAALGPHRALSPPPLRKPITALRRITPTHAARAPKGTTSPGWAQPVHPWVPALHCASRSPHSDGPTDSPARAPMHDFRASRSPHSDGSRRLTQHARQCTTSAQADHRTQTDHADSRSTRAQRHDFPRLGAARASLGASTPLRKPVPPSRQTVLPTHQHARQCTTSAQADHRTQTDHADSRSTRANARLPRKPITALRRITPTHATSLVRPQPVSPP